MYACMYHSLEASFWLYASLGGTLPNSHTAVYWLGYIPYLCMVQTLDDELDKKCLWIECFQSRDSIVLAC